jgi:hypothetical protein
MKPSLSERLFAQNPSQPEFALMSTLNWMRGLSILVQHDSFKSEMATLVTNSNCRRELSPDRQDTAFARLFLAQNYLAALHTFESTPNPYDIARLAIIAWYYCTYFSSHAMLAIAGHDVPEQHAKTASTWLDRLVCGTSKPLVPYPFCLPVKSLVEKTVEQECGVLKRDSNQNVNTKPVTTDQANDACISYLKGTADYYRDKEKKKMLESKQFKDKGLRDFRKHEARQMRDQKLSKRSIGFLDMAIRYRGKANYRDAIFLSYKQSGQSSHRMPEFINDLNVAADAYYNFAQQWVERHTPTTDWTHFLDDLTGHSLITRSIHGTEQHELSLAAID